MTQNSFELTGKCFSYIIKELLNWYWWILALVGFKMHSPACAFLQETTSSHRHIPTTRLIVNNYFLAFSLILRQVVLGLKPNCRGSGVGSGNISWCQNFQSERLDFHWFYRIKVQLSVITRNGGFFISIAYRVPTTLWKK